MSKKCPFAAIKISILRHLVAVMGGMQLQEEEEYDIVRAVKTQ